MSDNTRSTFFYERNDYYPALAGLVPQSQDFRTGGSTNDRTRSQYFYDVNTVGPEPYQMPGYTPSVNPLAPAPTQNPAYAGMSAYEIALSKYGYLANFLDHPEVGHIIRNAAENGHGLHELKGALHGTSWWQNTDAANRTWQLLVNEDPAEAARLSAETAATIQNRARTLGLSLSASEIKSLAWSATANGWTDEQIIDRLVSGVDFAKLEGGELQAGVDDVKALAGQFLVDVSDRTAQQYATRMASGELTLAGVAATFQRQAKQRFSWMGDMIDQGVTPSDYFAPMKSRIASELEVTEDSINLMDPKWMGLMERKDDKTGETRGATLYEATLAAREDPQWQSTQGAQEMAVRASSFLSGVFGRKAL